jgi:hypothetical protein
MSTKHTRNQAAAAVEANQVPTRNYTILRAEYFVNFFFFFFVKWKLRSADLLFVEWSLIGSNLNINNSLIKTANHDTNDGVHHNVWKFRVIHGDEVLRDLVWH